MGKISWAGKRVQGSEITVPALGALQLAASSNLFHDQMIFNGILL